LPPTTPLPDRPPALERQKTLNDRQDLQGAIRQYEQLERMGDASVEDRRRRREMQGDLDRVDRALGR